MKVENYQVERLSARIYQFHSDGVRGNIEMIIIFTPLRDNAYNLGFGVWNELLEKVDDSIETRNGDTDKILGTVAQTTLNFLSEIPEANIYATGSCPMRTRKYQMGINKHLRDLKEIYKVQGLVLDIHCPDARIGAIPDWQGEWQNLEPGVNYDAFLLSLK
jgi:hypothetical protein